MLEIQAFGPLDVRGSPEPLDAVLEQPTLAALLAYLVVSQPGITHRRGTLAGLFWPELPPAEAREALSRSLDTLEGELPEGVLQTQGDRLVGVIPKRVHCDVFDFEDAVAAGRWDRALALYQGDLLDGLDVPGAAGFHAWRDEERERLRRLAERARSRSAESS